MTDPIETIAIQNVVASTAFEQELDLETLAVDLPHAEFDPDNFAGLKYRTDSPKATSLIFRSGRVVTTGARSEAAIQTVLNILFDEIAALGIATPETPEITTQNIVSTADLGQRLNLNAIALGLGLENIEYEPEQFPGLVYRLDEPPVVVLLFGSGKFVVAGGKKKDDASVAVSIVETRLAELGLID